MMEAVHTIETMVYFNEVWCYIPEDCHLHTFRCDNYRLKSHMLVNVHTE
jgi:hypothetical protein